MNYQSYEEAIKAGAKGTDTITEPCDRCFGNGDIGYGKVEVYDVRVGAGVAQTCWKCFGRKTQTVDASDREDSFDFGFFKRPRKAELV